MVWFVSAKDNGRSIVVGYVDDVKVSGVAQSYFVIANRDDDIVATRYGFIVGAGKFKRRRFIKALDKIVAVASGVFKHDVFAAEINESIISRAARHCHVGALILNEIGICAAVHRNAIALIVERIFTRTAQDC